MGDRENCQCTNLHSQLKSKGPIDKTRSISVQSRRLAVLETLFDSDNRRFSCSDALVKYIPHARNRGLILKTNSNTVQNKRRRPCKNERTLMGSSDSVKTLNWEAIPYDEENVGKLVEVYGKNNVGKTSFLQHLQPTTENIEKGTTNISIIESFIFFLLSFFFFLFLTTLIFPHNVSHFKEFCGFISDQQYRSIVFTNSDSQTCFTFKNILRESLLEKVRISREYHIA